MRKQISNGEKLLKTIAVGVCVSMISMLIATFILSMLVHHERISVNGFKYGMMVILMVSGLLGSCTAIKRYGEKRVCIGALAGLAYGVVLLGMTALFFGGRYQRTMATLFLLLGMGIVSGLGSINRNGGNKRKYEFKMNR